ncbi:MAG: hypothetical protein QM704_22810 [Anaeromyxobacteraceae bacterium]
MTKPQKRSPCGARGSRRKTATRPTSPTPPCRSSKGPATTSCRVRIASSAWKRRSGSRSRSCPIADSFPSSGKMRVMTPLGASCTVSIAP